MLDEHTWAIVVGIEEYDFPSPLRGATNTAIQFAKLLCNRGVRPDRIYLRLSPLPEDVPGLPSAVKRGEAKWGSMTHLIEEELKDAEGHTLCVFWAGHGAAADGKRMVYLADSWVSAFTFDCEMLLRCLGQYSFEQQIVFFDACANEVSGSDTRAWPFKLKRSAPRCKRQFGFFAARLGQVAYFTEESGVYSHELICLLGSNRPPRTVEDLHRRLHNCFKRKGGPQQPWGYFRWTPNGDYDGLDTPPSNPFPDRPACFYGRANKDEKQKLVRLLLSDREDAKVIVLGTGGIGKTTLTIEVTEDPRVKAKYKDRRWLVPLEAAENEETFIQSLVNVLRLDKNSGINEVNDCLSKRPGLLVLDNLETPLVPKDGSVPGYGVSIINHLRKIGNIGGVALLASMRGTAPPAALRWTGTVRVRGLEDEEAKRLFQHHAPSVSLDDPYLQKFIHELAGIPLAIELVALNVAGGDLKRLWNCWLDIGPALARNTPFDEHRLTNLNTSIKLSLSFLTELD